MGKGDRFARSELVQVCRTFGKRRQDRIGKLRELDKIDNSAGTRDCNSPKREIQGDREGTAASKGIFLYYFGWPFH